MQANPNPNPNPDPLQKLDYDGSRGLDPKARLEKAFDVAEKDFN